jgi:hypothetical protein
MPEVIRSAALYCSTETTAQVSEDWAEGMLRLFAEQGLPVQECSYTNLSRKECGPLPFSKVRASIWRLLKTQSLLSLTLYAHRERESDLFMAWEGCAHIAFPGRIAFVGLPALGGITHGDLLRSLYVESKPMASWVYGISYDYPSSRAPALYAVGIGGGLLPEAGEKLPEDSPKHQDRVGCWFRDRIGPCRHLAGCFRDVYPGSLLSKPHVQGCLPGGQSLLRSGLGTFENIDEDIWLWQIPPTLRSRIRQLLKKAGLLICP